MVGLFGFKNSEKEESWVEGVVYTQASKLAGGRQTHS